MESQEEKRFDITRMKLRTKRILWWNVTEGLVDRDARWGCGCISLRYHERPRYASGLMMIFSFKDTNVSEGIETIIKEKEVGPREIIKRLTEEVDFRKESCVTTESREFLREALLKRN